MTTKGAAIAILVGSALAGIAILIGAWWYTSVPSRPAHAAEADTRAILPPAPPVETPVEHVVKLSFFDALTFAMQYMDDTEGKVSDGAIILAAWASRNMKWTDVAVTRDETSFALVRKDSDDARGKRLCTSGQIIQIEVHKFESGDRPVSVGLLMSGAGNLYNFIAAGSSGTLVEQSWARFCGVVTGKYDYANSAGGTGHAVSIVGMFDLPENRPKPVKPLSPSYNESPTPTPTATPPTDTAQAIIDNMIKAQAAKVPPAPASGATQSPPPAAPDKSECGCKGDLVCLMNCSTH
jgi:hypothetical protein